MRSSVSTSFLFNHVSQIPCHLIPLPAAQLQQWVIGNSLRSEVITGLHRQVNKNPLHRTIGQVKKSPFLVLTNPTQLGTFSTGSLRRSQWFSKEKENVTHVTLLTTGGIIVQYFNLSRVSDTNHIFCDKVQKNLKLIERHILRYCTGCSAIHITQLACHNLRRYTVRT